MRVPRIAGALPGEGIWCLTFALQCGKIAGLEIEPLIEMFVSVSDPALAGLPPHTSVSAVSSSRLGTHSLHEF